MHRVVARATRQTLHLPSRWTLHHFNASAQARPFHGSSSLLVIKPQILSDIGEGITEVQIIQWFVQPGARVEQFDKLCEVQSDKASVEITSRFDGVIKKLHYEADDMAKVGKPLLDLDIQGDVAPEAENISSPPAQQAGESGDAQQPPKAAEQAISESSDAASTIHRSSSRGKSATLATPAIRHLIKEHGLDISEIDGTGRDGRVMKEDIQKLVANREISLNSPSPSTKPTPSTPSDQTIPLTPTQVMMFKTMTRSLSIPHFLYSDSLDMTQLNALRKRLNFSLTAGSTDKLTLLPFIIKAVSIALSHYPILNARVDTDTNPSKPQLILRGAHNISIAVDTPQGLLVPVIKNVQTLSITEIAAEARRLGALGRTGKLSANDMTGGTFTVSNIGSVGGGVVAPVIVESQVGIVGIGKVKAVPAFDGQGNVIRREECVMSWSADHRVADGATVARCAEFVRGLLEEPGGMLVGLA